MAKFSGTPFDDFQIFTDAETTALGYGGADFFLGLADGDRFYGGDGGDTLLVFGGDDAGLYGGSGNDYLTLDGPDAPRATLGVLDGGSGDDVLSASTYDTALGGALHPVTITGGGGNDLIRTNQVAATIYGGTGDDQVNMYDGTASVAGGTGRDSLSYLGFGDRGVTFDGGGGDDRVDVQTVAGVLDVRTGDDADVVNLVMTPGAGGRAAVDAGSGNDNVFIRADRASVVAGAGADTVSTVGHEATVVAGSGDDWIGAVADHASLDAGSGRDEVYVRALQGAVGADFTVTLGGAPDLLVLEALAEDTAIAHVTITDFRSGNSGDTLDLSQALAVRGWTPADGDPFASGVLHLVQEGRDTVVQIAGTDQLLLEGVRASTLNTHNFDGFDPDSAHGFVI